MRQTLRIILKFLFWTLAVPILLFVLLASLLYVPSVQDYAVKRVCKMLSDKSGLSVDAKRIHLVFPLSLEADNVVAVEEGDTLLRAENLRLDVQVLPLFSGRANVNGIELRGTKLDSKDLIGGAHIRGDVGTITAATNGVWWENERVIVDYITLRDGDVNVCLSDSAMEDTAESKAKWIVEVMQAKMENVRAKVALPEDLPSGEDSVRGKQTWIAADLERALLKNGSFNTGSNDYALQGFDLQKGNIAYHTQGKGGLWTKRKTPADIPADKKGNHEDSVRAAYSYADNMAALDEWQPFEAAAKKGDSAFPDVDDLAVTDASIKVEGLSYNNKGELRTNIAHASFKEKSGIAVDNFSGQVYLDDERINVPKFQMKTASGSTINMELNTTWDALSSANDGLDLDADMQLTYDDVQHYGKDILPADLLKAYPHETLSLRGKVSGSMDNLRMQDLHVDLPNHVSGEVSGNLRNLTNGGVPTGDVDFDLTTGSQLPSFYKRYLPDVAESVSLPNKMKAKGNVKFAGDDIDVDTRIGAGNGTADVKGRVNTAKEAYTAHVKTNNFNPELFLPGSGLSPITATIDAKGSGGFNPLEKGANLQAKANIQSFNAAGYDLSNTDLNASVKGGQANVDFAANNSSIQGTGTLQATLGKRIEGRLDGDFDNIDLLKLGLASDSLSAGGRIGVNFSANDDFSEFDADGTVGSVFLQSQTRGFSTDDVNFSVGSAADSTYATAESGDLSLRFGTKGGVEKLLPRLSQLAKVAQEQIENREIDQEALKRELPPMDLYLKAGPNNPVSNFVRFKGYTFDNAYIDLHTHPQTGVNGLARVGGLTNGSLLIDTINVAALQDSSGVKLNGFVRNYTKRNPTKFDAKFKGYVLSKGVGAEVEFYDADGEKGLELGAVAEHLDDGLHVSIYPKNPVLAYRTFSINEDNYVFLGRHNGQLRADIDLLADDGTGLKIYSVPSDSVNDITVSVNNVNLGELSNVLPYLPKMEGTLSGDVHIFDNHQTISAMGSLSADDFAYEGTRLGTVGADVVYLPKGKGEHYASAYLSSAGEEVLEAEGTYFENDETFDGTAHLHDFPLPMLNAFLEGTDVALKGKAGGDLAITGKLSDPIMNGTLDLDSAHIYSPVYGFDFRCDTVPLTFQNSKILFQNYNLYSTGTNPLTVNGNVNLTDLSNVSLDLRLQAKQFELINAEKTRQSLVFGKSIVDFIGTVKGPVDDLSIRGKVDVLDKTDLTYILRDTPLSTDYRLDDLVQFVSFEDSDAVEMFEPESSSNIDMVLALNVSDQANFHCYLSEDGKNYADINGGGALTLRLTRQGDMRLTGKITAQSGEIKYELPVIPLRTFQLVQGSTIEFTGEPSNPTLNVQAKERMKVPVTEDDVQRTVAFDVGVALTKPLDQMGLEFTIEAPDDLSIQSQLAAMTDEQRNKVAVALMATGMYLTESGAGTSGFKANNALNAFLQNEIQNIAGKALKTVDLSVGVETGTSLTGTTTTDYSFQFSKRFWNDKIRVIVGGRVSAGKNADNRAESIINNVAVEYTLNKGATQYFRVFYDRDQEDPFEGQLTSTGVGYSVRKKSDNLGDLILFWRKEKGTEMPAPPEGEAPKEPAGEDAPAAAATPADTTESHFEEVRIEPITTTEN